MTVSVAVLPLVIATIDPVRGVPGEGLGVTVKVNVALPLLGPPPVTLPPPLIQETVLDAVAVHCGLHGCGTANTDTVAVTCPPADGTLSKS